MRKASIYLLTLLVLALALVACQAETVEVTRVITETVLEEVEVPVEVTRVVTETVEVEGEMVEVTRIVEVAGDTGEKTIVEFWTTDNEEERVNTYEAVAARYMEMHPEVEIRIVPIEEGGITQRHRHSPGRQPAARHRPHGCGTCRRFCR